MKTSHCAFSRAAPALLASATACASTPAHEHVHHGAMHHRFDDPARWAEMFDAPDRDAWQRPDEVVSLMEPMPEQTIADIGAGTGYFLARLSRAVGERGHVLGVDLEPSMVEYMTARAQREGLANVEARLAAADDPHLMPASVDRILIVDTWHHIESRAAYAAKLREALAPGGAVFVVDFDGETERGPPKEHRLTTDAVVAELTAGGLVADVMTESLPDQYVVRGRRP